MKNIVLTIVGVGALGALLWWGGSLGGSDPDVIATRGIHWHPELSIYLDGEKQNIPGNIGLIGEHQPIHTHTEDVGQDILHFEFESVVRIDDIRLSNFFKSWDKDIHTAFGTLDTMMVNGEENTEYGEYVVGEKDKIELFYVSVEEGAV